METELLDSEALLVGLAFIVALGIGAQWLAWRLRLPSILLLLLFGFIAGPVGGLLDPDAMFGDVLLPLVSLSVGVILFEGGLSLKVRELMKIGSDVRNLIGIGVPLAWVLISALAYLVLGLEIEFALIIGAILVVTGPTVVLPMIRFLRPRGDLGPILKWEGILNDVVGATLAVLTLEGVVGGRGENPVAGAALGALTTLIAGGGLGVAAGFLLTFLLQRYWIPDHLHSPMALMLAVVGFAAADHVHPESGLVMTTVMGIVLANQRKVSIQHVVEFKENLRVLLISSLFILLSSRLDLQLLEQIGYRDFLWVGLLLFVVRPATVFISTMRSKLSFREKLFLSWMAPRGIVAAAVSSVFALRLLEAGFENAERLVALTFLTIVSTITVYGLTGPFVAKWLRVSDAHPQGFLLIGAHDWARKIANALQEQGVRVRLADTNWGNIRTARMEGLSTYYGNVLSEHVVEDLDFTGIGRLLALTPNDYANSLATLHFTEFFGREGVYQLATESADGADDVESPSNLRGRSLFCGGSDHVEISRRFSCGAVVKTTNLTAEYTFEHFKERYSEDALILFVLPDDKDVWVATMDRPLDPQPGHRIVALVNP